MEGDSSECWPANLSCYIPEVDYDKDIQKVFQKFENSLLAHETSVTGLCAFERDGNLISEEHALNHEEIKKVFSRINGHSRESRFFFIHRFLVKNKLNPVPRDAAKLRISGEALRIVMQGEEASPSFACALAQYFQPPRRASRKVEGDSMKASYTLWYFLPTRVQVDCTDQQQNHARSTGGSNQLDPFHYLHLPDAQVDIRGSRIGIHIRHNAKEASTTAILVNFMDGRWSKLVEEPCNRVKDTIRRAKAASTIPGPITSHLVLLTCVSRWYTNSLTSTNKQLVAYEKALQDEMDRDSPSSSALNSNVNRALHAMAAHLHRFKSELEWLENTTAWLQRTLKDYHPAEEAGHESLEFAATQLKSANDFAVELEKKIQNILALLFNRIQIANDKIMVENGNAMHEIMKATQEEAKMSRHLAIRSQRLGEEMRKDSIAMKTIAVVTMVFLPGTSFAALLSMPFFAQSKWLQNASRFWIWILLTIPTTIAAFIIYGFRQRRERRLTSLISSKDDLELSLRPQSPSMALEQTV